MHKIIAILSKEIKYAERLKDYLESSGRLRAEAAAFSDIEELKRFTLRHRIALLIADLCFARRFDPSVATGAEDIETPKRIYLGADDRDIDIFSREGGERIIRKYQSADAIIKEIERLLPDLRGASYSPGIEGRARVIGIYSHIGRTGKTSFALALTRELSRRARTLYIGLEEFSPIGRLMGIGDHEGISEACYLMQQGRLTGERISEFTVLSGGIEWIPPLRDPSDQNEIRAADYKKLVELMSLYGGYSYIVLDMNRWFEQADGLLDICSLVYMPAPHDEIARIKQDEFMDYIRGDKGDKWAERIRLIDIPAPDRAKEGTYVEGLAYGGMGDYVRGVLKETETAYGENQRRDP